MSNTPHLAPDTRVVEPRTKYVIVRKSGGHLVPADEYTYVLEASARESAQILNDEEAENAAQEMRTIMAEWIVMRAITTYEEGMQ